MPKLHEILVRNAKDNAKKLQEVLKKIDDDFQPGYEPDGKLHSEMEIISAVLKEDLEILAEGTPDGELNYVIGQLSGIEFPNQILTSVLEKLEEKKRASKSESKENKKFKGNATHIPPLE